MARLTPPTIPTERLRVARRPSLWPKLAGYAAAVAIVLTLCDWAGHVLWDTLIYSEPEVGSLLPGQPTARVFLGFVALAVPLTLVAWWAFGQSSPPRVSVTLALLGTFTAAYLLSGPLDGIPMLLLAGLMLVWVAQLGWFRPAVYPVVVFSVVLAVIGPIAEGLYSASGFFAYTDEAVFGVPAWLGPLYLNGALAVAASMATLGQWLRRETTNAGS